MIELYAMHSEVLSEKHKYDTFLLEASNSLIDAKHKMMQAICAGKQVHN